MDVVEDPYQTLGVARDASAEDIRSAYRKLAKQHHPDLNPGNAGAVERFKTIAAANDLLSDPDKRAQFDRGEIDATGQPQAPRSTYRDYAETGAGRRYSQSGPQSAGWSHEDFGDIFGSMFRGEAESFGNAPRRGSDELYTLTTDFLSTVKGATQRLSLPGGRVLDVKIPAGTVEGDVLRLAGQGSAGWNGGAAGDAMIEIHVTPHPHFKRDGRDIRLELPITLSEAVLGAQISAPTPAGPVRLRIPPHSDSGSMLRLRGRGLPAHGRHQAGDLYVKLRIVIGKPDATLEAFLREWQPADPADPRQGMEITG